MIFSTDVREDIAKWATDNKVDPNTIVAYETGNPPPKRKLGFTYEPISIPVDVPGMKFYKKIATAPVTSVPKFDRLDGDPTPEMRHPAQPKPRATGIGRFGPKVKPTSTKKGEPKK
jgi:hypothetical protein